MDHPEIPAFRASNGEALFRIDPGSVFFHSGGHKAVFLQNALFPTSRKARQGEEFCAGNSE
jgi:hypothetical protein